MMEFKTARLNEVTLFHPDGMYLTEDGRTKKQIVIVGPMHFAPQEIADHFDDGAGYEVTEITALPGTDFVGTEADKDRARRMALARGFISIIIEHIKEHG